MSVDYFERFVTVPGGVKLFLRDYPACGQGAVRAPVLCLHGLTRNSADFEGVAPRIAALGRRVLALDVRGRGRSDHDPQVGHYRPDVYVTDVLHVLDSIGIERAIFVGTSMGGLITMLLATQAPARVVAAVLNDVGPILNPTGLARIVGYVGNIGPYPSWEAIYEAIRTTQAIAFPDADVDFWKTFAHRVAHQDADGRISFAYDPAIARAFNAPPEGGGPDLMAAFSALAAKPILVVHGAVSDILTTDGLDAMRKIKPNLAIVEVPRVGHAPTLEEPVARDALRQFLDSHP